MTEEKKPTCFVIQEFDEGGRFDRRYTETIHPALIAAGVKPLRADKMLGLQPIIQRIESAIREADICIAEVSVDNPNVWLELGYALALDRPVIIYRTDSRSGYEDLEKRIVQEVKTQLETAKRVAKSPVLSRGTQDINDLKGYEVALLASLLAMWPSSPEGVSGSELERQIKRLGYDGVDLGFGITRLIEKHYIQKVPQYDINGNEWPVFTLTPEGMAWLHSNEDKIEKAPLRQTRNTPASDFDNDIPF